MGSIKLFTPRICLVTGQDFVQQLAVERVLGGDLNAPISIIASKIDLESISKRHRLHLSCMLQGAFPYFSTLAAVNCALSAASGKGTGYPCTTL